MKKINVQMVDLMGQYSKIKHEIDKNITISIINITINGKWGAFKMNNIIIYKFFYEAYIQ